ncbi:putative sinapoylglucose--sinapoylglucose O-sinapoyltransferase [Helianthus annuus]|uniref:Putative serine carboxypeptidase-like 1 n=1 Tax=Helianthus annuus TaxID=4232 RepID=A0A251S2F1_HELAN|nr:serine carboxypeptidase-like 2 isoform X1 [Helianthus annuus]KAF5761646.1 putative sinapoylglucose--sinapoylglucose O-sinapoyltransferase [Helianthus annuus]
MFLFYHFILLLTLQSYFITLSHSGTIVKNLPGYSGDLPFKLETGYVGVGGKEEVQLFYYFVESQSNPEDDPVICYIPGGPGTSALLGFLYETGPLSINVDNDTTTATLLLNEYSWTKTASIIFVDMLAGSGFSYAKTKEAWISSDSIMAAQGHEFVKKFLMDHPKFLKNPLYIKGVSYTGIVAPVITMKVYEGNERGDQPTLNIQGYILGNPLTDKFMDYNSRLKYAHRVALISDNIYESAVENCHGNYVNIDIANELCAHSLQRYKQCTNHITITNILEPFCYESYQGTPYCQDPSYDAIQIWANSDTARHALNISEGTIGKWEIFNTTIHYDDGKNDTFCYAYDIFSSLDYHKELTSKNCRALIFSGDHDMTFPYVGLEQWIASLSIRVEEPWEPYFVDDQVGGYQMTYAQNDFSLTFATVKGAGHSAPSDKPKESMYLIKRWLASRTDSSSCLI